MGHEEVQTAARQPPTSATLVSTRCETGTEALRSLATGRAAPRLDNGSRVSREIHARFHESRGVRSPSATHHCRPAAARAVESKLHSGSGSTRVTRTGALSDQPGPGADRGGESAAEGARRRQRQAGICGHEHPGSIWARDAAGAHRWGNEYGGDGRVRPRTVAGQTSRARTRPGRTVRAAPALSGGGDPG